MNSPPTHVNARQSAEVMPVAEHEALRDAAVAVSEAFASDYPNTPSRLGAAIVRLRKVIDD